MESAKSENKMECISLVPENIPEEITESDYQNFLKVISIDLNEKQKAQIVNPPQTFPQQETVLAVHWHPEFVPMHLISQRIKATFPNRKQELVIPTQHNEIIIYNGYAGVEVDCYSKGFNQKVQLLLHFESAKLEEAGVLKEMLAHTFKYRSSQLFDFIHTITKPIEERLNLAAGETGVSDSVIRFVQTYVKKIERLLEENASVVPVHSVKNKLLRNFFDCLRAEYNDALIDRSQIFLTAVKKVVKQNFSLKYFYRTSEIIEEARHLGAGIVIPHPEQFWPVLLAEYDVDGYEVWNPQSQRYTKFLISVLRRNNNRLNASQRPLLVFMGDDTHMGEKTRDPKEQNKEKASREIGIQPAWQDMNIRKTLIKGNFNRRKVIEEYKNRLGQ
ncbi:hypothetical protein [Desulfonema magnum]|uniref:Uncharacterized protein n=1 Tax=Desulfonema magnum TaxID=45655 RepID=A0A975BXM8_9BACT|nr:hypothetical protein [Desulfonema magnum]QTA93631.1 Uncharacterized protein dnm_097350 [Desulfonema magnum]